MPCGQGAQIAGHFTKKPPVCVSVTFLGGAANIADAAPIAGTQCREDVPMKQTLATTALAAAIGLALAMGAAQAQQAAKPLTKEQQATMERMQKYNLEKCYGVAARGKNDCAEGAHSCVGQASIDRDKASFVLVPK